MINYGCYMIYLIILCTLILYIYIHRRLVDFFFKLKLIWYYVLWNIIINIIRKANIWKKSYQRLFHFLCIQTTKEDFVRFNALNLKVWYFKSIYCHVLTKESVTQSKNRRAPFVRFYRWNTLLLKSFFT